MNKILRISMIAVLAFIANFSFGQTVTLDFSTNNWKLPEGSTKKLELLLLIQMELIPLA